MAPIPSYTSLLRPMRVYASYKNFGFSQKKSVWLFHLSSLETRYSNCTPFLQMSSTCSKILITNKPSAA